MADRALAESYLRGMAESELLTGIPVQTYVPVGLISPSILTMAAEKHADIIVMCSHGYTGVKRWWTRPQSIFMRLLHGCSSIRCRA